MKSIELGDYDTFSGLLSLFTAVIGLAYPFILQAIERIQERYITERGPMEIFSGRGGNPLMEYRYN